MINNKAASFCTVFLLVILVVFLSIQMEMDWNSQFRNLFDSFGKTNKNNGLSELKEFPTINPYKCVQTNELYGGIKTKICLKPFNVDRFISEKIANLGAFEGSKVSVMLKAMSMYPKAVFLDMGSNIGMYTIMMAAAGREVVAVDAMLVNLAYIHHSLTVDGTTQYVTLLNNAVSNRREMLFPILDDRANEGATRLVPGHLINSKLQAVGPPVNSTTMLDLLNFINTDIVIVKMDVEGFECKVLHQYLIDDHPAYYLPYINMEWALVRRNMGSNCPDILSLVDALYTNNYEPYRLPGNGPGDQGIPNTLNKIERTDLTKNSCSADILWANKDAPALFW